MSICILSALVIFVSFVIKNPTVTLCYSSQKMLGHKAGQSSSLPAKWICYHPDLVEISHFI